MELLNSKTEEEKKQKEKCFFDIEIERVNHIKRLFPNQQKDGRIESESEKYLAVLEERTRLFLGIKRCYKKYYGDLNQFVFKNSYVNYIGNEFLFRLSGNVEPRYIQMDINDEKNEFFSRYYGINLFDLFKLFDKEKINWEHSSEDDPIHKRFIELKEQNDVFNAFLSDEYEKKNIYISAYNGYDLGLHPFLDIGIVDEFSIDNNEIRFFHIYQIKLKHFELASFQQKINAFYYNLIRYIKTTFIFSQVAINSESFIPVVFDIKGIHRKSKLADEPDLLKEAIRLNVQLKKFIKGKSVFSYLDVYNFIIGYSTENKPTTKNPKFKKIKSVLAKNLNSENQLKKIIKVVLKADNARIARETELETEHTERKPLLEENNDPIT